MAFANGWRGPDIVADGLVLYLDAGSPNSYRPDFGTTWKDMSGNNYTGSLVNGPTYSTASGGSIFFDGVDDYTSFSTTNLVVNTINTWVYLKSAANSAVIYSGGDGYNSGGWEWSIFILTNSIYFRGNAGGGGAINYPVSNYINQWKNFTLIRDFNSRCYLYENGVYKNDSADSSTNNTNQLRLCKAGSNYANTDIANIQIYNRALSSTEVLQNYNAQKSRFGL
jgi:hypothetical protein